MTGGLFFIEIDPPVWYYFGTEKLVKSKQWQ